MPNDCEFKSEDVALQNVILILYTHYLLKPYCTYLEIEKKENLLIQIYFFKYNKIYQNGKRMA